MATYYGTLPLAGEGGVEEAAIFRRSAGPRVKRMFLVVAAAGLVAMAGVASFSSGVTSSQSVLSTVDKTYEYKALDATPVNCDKQSDSYMSGLPRWDMEFSTEEDFFNACYYSFRCCTTTGNGDGCYVSDNFGAMCRACLKHNSPRFVKKDCVDWINDKELTKDQHAMWGLKDLMDDNGVPQTGNELYAVMFKNYPGAPKEENGMVDTRSCWQPRGPGDKQVLDFAQKCFEVLSWCNLLCPRDSPQTVDHVMCKHCTLFGFKEGYFDHDNWEKTLFGQAAGAKKIVMV